MGVQQRLRDQAAALQAIKSGMAPTLVFQSHAGKVPVSDVLQILKPYLEERKDLKEHRDMRLADRHQSPLSLVAREVWSCSAL